MQSQICGRNVRFPFFFVLVLYLSVSFDKKIAFGSQGQIVSPSLGLVVPEMVGLGSLEMVRLENGRLGNASGFGNGRMGNNRFGNGKVRNGRVVR